MDWKQGIIIDGWIIIRSWVDSKVSKYLSNTTPPPKRAISNTIQFLKVKNNVIALLCEEYIWLWIAITFSKRWAWLASVIDIGSDWQEIKRAYSGGMFWELGIADKFWKL